MSQFHLGIDVAKAKLDCALRLPNGKFRAKVIANSPEGFALLVKWLVTHNAHQPHVCMEATGIYWEDVAQYLATAGLTVSVINPAQIKAYASSRLTRTKTDAVDAKLIADFCAERQPSAWQARSEAEIALRALVLRLDATPRCIANHAHSRKQSSRGLTRSGARSHSTTSGLVG